jgi:hypothetical protein
MSLSLYLIDDSSHATFLDEIWYTATWAETSQHAIDLAWEIYPHRDEQGAEIGDLAAQLVQDLGVKAHIPALPGIEERPIVLRLAGWAEDGELQCSYCGLFPNGLAEYQICEACEQCIECGHTEDCEDAQ